MVILFIAVYLTLGFLTRCMLVGTLQYNASWLGISRFFIFMSFACPIAILIAIPIVYGRPYFSVHRYTDEERYEFYINDYTQAGLAETVKQIHPDAKAFAKAFPRDLA